MRYATLLLTGLFALQGSIADGKTRAVSHPSDPLDVVLMIKTFGDPGPDQIYEVVAGVYDHIPNPMITDFRLKDPDGRVQWERHHESYCFDCKPSDWQDPKWRWFWLVWHGPLPAGWPSGVSSFEISTKRNAQQVTATAKFAVNVASPPQLGPLERTVVDANGGVMLFGAFPTPPVVADIQLYRMKLSDGYYIPPGAMYDQTGDTTIVVCSGVRGDIANLECTTEQVRLPGATSHSNVSFHGGRFLGDLCNENHRTALDRSLASTANCNTDAPLAMGNMRDRCHLLHPIAPL